MGPPLKRRRSDFLRLEEAEEEKEEENRGAVSVSYQKEETAFMSKEEIERLSPSRKDGIDLYLETSLRYSYCSYLQSLGMRLEL